MLNQFVQRDLDEVGVSKIVLDRVQSIAEGAKARLVMAESYRLREFTLGVLLTRFDPPRQPRRCLAALDQVLEFGGLLLVDPAALLAGELLCLAGPLRW